VGRAAGELKEICRIATRKLQEICRRTGWDGGGQGDQESQLVREGPGTSSG